MKTFARLGLGGSALSLFAAIAGCAGPAEEDTVTAQSQALKVSPVSPGIGGGGLVITRPAPAGWSHRAPPVSAPAYFSAGGRSSNAASLSWYETGNPINPETQIHRQQYDLDDRPVGPPKLVRPWSGCPRARRASSTARRPATTTARRTPTARSATSWQEKNGERDPARADIPASVRAGNASTPGADPPSGRPRAAAHQDVQRRDGRRAR